MWLPILPWITKDRKENILGIKERFEDFQVKERDKLASILYFSFLPFFYIIIRGV